MDHILEYRQKERHRVVGLMSGTSADGVDAALAEVSGSGENLRAQLACYHTSPFSPDTRQAILRLSQPHAPVQEVCRTNFALGRLFAQAALTLIEKAGLRPQDIDLIASHGQTVCHLPEKRSGQANGLSAPLPASTLQIAEPAVIAELTGIAVVADFRPRDIAAGGQGAPLVPYADWALLRHPQRSRVIQNIGGIANLTYLPAGGALDQVIAFDTGPGNMVIDAAISRLTAGRLTFDRNGEMAAKGRPDGNLLSWMMSHPYLSKSPPKSTGREEFGEEFVGALLAHSGARALSPEDLMATVTAFTAESIAHSYRQFVLPRGEIHEVVLGGGGTYNLTLCDMLRSRLPGVRMLRHEDLGLDSKAKEALAFAILGHETMMGRPANVPSATGAAKTVILGKIVLP